MLQTKVVEKIKTVVSTILSVMR